VKYFPAEKGNVVSKLTFDQSHAQEDPLYAYLSKRHTNRQNYETRKLPIDAKKQLIEEVEKLGLAKCTILDSDKDITELSIASTAVERLMFESKTFHRFYYEHFYLNQAQEDELGGFYVDVLGLGGFERRGIWLNSFWPIARAIGTLGLWQPLNRMRIAHYKKTGAFAAIITPSNDRTNYIDTGRSFERLWLRATQLGIELQPCVGVLLLYESLVKQNFAIFTPKQRNIIKTGRNKILERFGDRGQGVPMFFRLGYAPPPKARAFRKEPIIDFIA
jgi:hypothetical protein